MVGTTPNSTRESRYKPALGQHSEAAWSHRPPNSLRCPRRVLPLSTVGASIINCSGGRVYACFSAHQFYPYEPDK